MTTIIQISILNAKKLFDNSTNGPDVLSPRPRTALACNSQDFVKQRGKPQEYPPPISGYPAVSKNLLANKNH